MYFIYPPIPQLISLVPQPLNITPTPQPSPIPPRDYYSSLDQLRLAGNQSAVGDGRGMSPGNVSVDGQEPVQEGQDFLGTRGVPPVAHQIADDREHADELDTRLLHAGVGSVADERRVSAAGLDVGEDGVTFSTEREGEESGADIGSDSGNDDLLLASGLDGGAELRVVPCTGGKVSCVREKRSG